MITSIRLQGKGDGKKRTEDLLIEAIHEIGKNPSVRIDFENHPLLRQISPSELLEKISKKRVGRLIESGILDLDFSCEPDSIFPRGRSLDVTLPLAILLSELDFLPPAPNRERITVLYEDKNFIAIDKPAGLPSAPIRSDDIDSATQRVLALYPSLPILRGNPLEPGLIHRLDNGTSGVLLFAKTIESFSALGSLWSTPVIKKTYRAIVSTESNSRLRLGRVELKIGHDLKSKKRMRVVESPSDLKKIRGSPSQSISEILNLRELARTGKNRIEDVEIRIETGVHHQIRATLAYLGAPILGDLNYNGAPHERICLHAWKLLLPAYEGKPTIEITAPLPISWTSSS